MGDRKELRPRGQRLKETYRLSCPKGTWLKFSAVRFLTHVNISAGSFVFDEIHNGMYRGLMQFRSAYCGLHRVEKLHVAARCPARVLVVSPTSSGSRSQYVQADGCRPTQSKEKKALSCGTDLTGRADLCVCRGRAKAKLEGKESRHPRGSGRGAADSK